MVIENIDSIFDLVGSIGSASIMLLFPGLAYIVSFHTFGSSHYRKKWSTIFYYVMAWCFLVFYVIAIALYFYLLVLKYKPEHSATESGIEDDLDGL